MRRVVVATDFSEGSERALSAGIQFAKLLGAAAIDLIHVYPSPTRVVAPIPGVAPMPFPGPEVLEGIQERIEDQSRKISAQDLGCLTVTAQGNPSDEIVAYADKIGADLIVVGTHGRSGLSRAILGSVAEHVLRKARTPVLVVPSLTPPSSRTDAAG
jgi:nucleotide-binding universal stress UspA family protein